MPKRIIRQEIIITRRRNLTKISVVMPCLNEAGSVGRCISTDREALEKLQLEGEVIVVDNDSTDGSAEIARKHGAKVVHEPRQGYGNAYLRGFHEAKGEIIVMGDADGIYSFELIPEFAVPILNGEADFVIGSRLRGNILSGAMPWLHRYIGNPLLTKILNLLFGSSISDAHCGMRALKKDALEKMSLKTSGKSLSPTLREKAESQSY